LYTRCMGAHRTFAAALVGALAAGCWVVLGIEERPIGEPDAAAPGDGSDREQHDGNGNAGSGDGGSEATVVVLDAAGDGPPTCTCLPEVPTGWDGPFVADELADCAGVWTDAGVVHAAFDAGTSACSCSCSAAEPQCLYKNYYNGCGNSSCSVNPLDLKSVQTCFMPSTNCGQFAKIIVDGGGPCLPTAGMTKDTPAFGRDIRKCTGPVLTGVCPKPQEPCAAERPATATYCISKLGDLPCPPSYGTRSLYHEGFADNRSCTTCTCAETGGPCDVGWFGTDGTCAAASRTGTITTTCQAEPSLNSYLQIKRFARSCAASGGAKTGQAAPTDPITFCCRTD
jgi:hypothetical protein